MEPDQREALEQRIREGCASGDPRGAATVAVEGYGPEVFGFLVGMLGDTTDSEEAFSIFCEDLWSGIARFEWRCSFRTWAYVLARNAMHRLRMDRGRHRQREVPLSRSPELEQRVRTATLAYLRTEVKNRFAELRRRLDPDDQELLILRVDRNLAWNDLAQVMHQDGASLAGEELAREGARLRKRFQLVKDRLRELARVEGLIPDGAE